MQQATPGQDRRWNDAYNFKHVRKTIEISVCINVMKNGTFIFNNKYRVA